MPSQKQLQTTNPPLRGPEVSVFLALEAIPGMHGYGLVTRTEHKDAPAVAGSIRRLWVSMRSWVL